MGIEDVFSLSGALDMIQNQNDSSDGGGGGGSSSGSNSAIDDKKRKKKKIYKSKKKQRRRDAEAAMASIKSGKPVNQGAACRENSAILKNYLSPVVLPLYPEFISNYNIRTNISDKASQKKVSLDYLAIPLEENYCSEYCKFVKKRISGRLTQLRRLASYEANPSYKRYVADNQLKKKQYQQQQEKIDAARIESSSNGRRDPQTKRKPDSADADQVEECEIEDIVKEYQGEREALTSLYEVLTDYLIMTFLRHSKINDSDKDAGISLSVAIYECLCYTLCCMVELMGGIKTIIGDYTDATDSDNVDQNLCVHGPDIPLRLYTQKQLLRSWENLSQRSYDTQPSESVKRLRMFLLMRTAQIMTIREPAFDDLFENNCNSKLALFVHNRRQKAEGSSRFVPFVFDIEPNSCGAGSETTTDFGYTQKIGSKWCNVGCQTQQEFMTLFVLSEIPLFVYNTQILPFRSPLGTSTRVFDGMAQSMLGVKNFSIAAKALDNYIQLKSKVLSNDIFRREVSRVWQATMLFPGSKCHGFYVKNLTPCVDTSELNTILLSTSTIGYMSLELPTMPSDYFTCPQSSGSCYSTDHACTLMVQLIIQDSVRGFKFYDECTILDIEEFAHVLIPTFCVSPYEGEANNSDDDDDDDDFADEYERQEKKRKRLKEIAQAKDIRLAKEFPLSYNLNSIATHNFPLHTTHFYTRDSVKKDWSPPITHRNETHMPAIVRINRQFYIYHDNIYYYIPDTYEMCDLFTAITQKFDEEEEEEDGTDDYGSRKRKREPMSDSDGDYYNSDSDVERSSKEVVLEEEEGEDVKDEEDILEEIVDEIRPMDDFYLSDRCSVYASLAAWILFMENVNNCKYIRPDGTIVDLRFLFEHLQTACRTFGRNSEKEETARREEQVKKSGMFVLESRPTIYH
jgi:hypothetical protein